MQPQILAPGRRQESRRRGGARETFDQRVCRSGGAKQVDRWLRRAGSTRGVLFENDDEVPGPVIGEVACREDEAVDGLEVLVDKAQQPELRMKVCPRATTTGAIAGSSSEYRRLGLAGALMYRASDTTRMRSA